MKEPEVDAHEVIRRLMTHEDTLYFILAMSQMQTKMSGQIGSHDATLKTAALLVANIMHAANNVEAAKAKGDVETIQSLRMFTEITISGIRAEMGDRIADIVMEMSGWKAKD